MPGKGPLVRTGSSPDLVPRLRAHTASGLSQSATAPPSEAVLVAAAAAAAKKDKKEKKEKKQKKQLVPESVTPPRRRSMEGPPPTVEITGPVTITNVPLKR